MLYGIVLLFLSILHQKPLQQLLMTLSTNMEVFQAPLSCHLFERNIRLSGNPAPSERCLSSRPSVSLTLGSSDGSPPGCRHRLARRRGHRPVEAPEVCA